jgi:cysteine-rich repeat protein
VANASRQALLGAAIFLLVSLRAHASIYYVDPTGNDAASGGAAEPWRTIQHAANHLAPGDTVIVQAGVYAESVFITISGAAGSPITYHGLSGAVLQSPDPSASLSAFDIRPGVAYVTVDGFEARGNFHETIFIRSGAHHIGISNCYLHNNRVGILIDSATDIEIDNCQIRDNSALGLRVSGTSQDVTIRDTVSAGHDDGLGCAGDADGFDVEETASQVTFLDCQAVGNGEDGFDLQGNELVLARIESRGNTCAGIKIRPTARIENSVITGNTTGIATCSNNSPGTLEVVNSTVADNAGTQLNLDGPITGGAPPVSYDVLLRNVIAAGPGKAIEVATAVLLTEDHNILFREDTTSRLLVHHLGGDAERLYSGQEINAGVWTAESGQGGGTFAVDPDFDGTDEYGVLPTSTALESGDATGAPTEDRNGTKRPQGNQVDIGPDEAGAGVVNHRPWADPGPDRSTRVGAVISFSGYGSVDPDGDPLTFSWDFGDSTPAAAGYSVTHFYSAADTYAVTLTVSDGLLSRSRTALVNVAPALTPTPTLTATGTSTPAATPTPTDTPMPTDTATATGTATDTPSPTPTVTPSLCGNGVHETAEECDDGNTEDGDGCSATCRLELIPGRGSRRTDCLTEWMVVNPHNTPLHARNGRIPAKQTCRDNDPACDFDGGVPNSCTFHVALCVNITDDTLPRCKPKPLVSYEIMRPSSRQAMASVQKASLRTTIDDTAGSMLAAPDGTCSLMMNVTVPLTIGRTGLRKHAETVRTRVTAVDGARDTDTLKFICTP